MCRTVQGWDIRLVTTVTEKAAAKTWYHKKFRETFVRIQWLDTIAAPHILIWNYSVDE